MSGGAAPLEPTERSRLTTGLVRGTAWMLMGHGVRLALQAVYFVALARLLGASSMGAFVGTLAIANVFAPFAGVGTGQMLVRSVSRDPSSFSTEWGRALLVTAISGSVLCLLVISICALVLPGSVHLSALLCIAISELLAVRVVELSAQAFQGHHQLSRTAQAHALLSVLRVLAVFALWLMTPVDPSLVSWSWLYLIASVLAAFVGALAVTRFLGSPSFGAVPAARFLREGLLFSVSMSAQSAHNDIDKSLLARLVSLSEAGVYGAAYRIIDISLTPIRALMYSAYARFFEAGANGTALVRELTRLLFPWLAVYGAVTSLAIYVAAPLVLIVLGAEYAMVVPVLKTLAVLPLLRALQALPADALTGSGFQGRRSALQVGVALVSVGLGWAMISSFGWRGAAWTSLATDALLAALLWGTFLNSTRVSSPTESQSDGIAVTVLTDVSAAV